MGSVPSDRKFSKAIERGRKFDSSSREELKRLATKGPTGNRWFKVNLHVHGQGNDAAHMVEAAREAELDLIAITDHQSFNYYEAIAREAEKSGRNLAVLPGMEVTTLEGAHLLSIFPASQTSEERTRFLGWLEIPGTGATRIASTQTLDAILQKVNELDHRYALPKASSPDIQGFLESAADELSASTDDGLIREPAS